jgi:integrase
MGTGETAVARRLKDQTLDNREARRRLKIRPKPYYRTVERGLHVGFRRLGGGQAGSWIARYYVGAQQYEVTRIGTADDVSDADGVHVLDFWQAVAKARAGMVERAHRAAGHHGSLTVAGALDRYVEYLEREKKSARDARYRIDALITPALGKVEVSKLTADTIRDWRDSLVKTGPRLRTREGSEQRHAEVDDADALRARRVSANRVLVTLKAALNRAWRDGKVTSNAAWTRVEPFKSVNIARVRYLTVAEAQRLINACDHDFRLLVQAGLQAGARYGELCALQVRDWNSDSGTLAIRDSKSGKPRHVVLTEEGMAFFRQVCAGRSGAELMLRRADGQGWRKSTQCPLMVEACQRAKISPPISFHGLRHTWASLAVMNGTPLMVVARNLGHSSTRMVEEHYGHLAPNYVADAIRAGAPRFGFEPDEVVTPMVRS